MAFSALKAVIYDFSQAGNQPRRRDRRSRHARVHFTGKECAQLWLLSLRKGTTLTKDTFLNHLYGGMNEPELKIINVFIYKLRKQLSLACDGENLHRDLLGSRLRDPEEVRVVEAHVA